MGWTGLYHRPSSIPEYFRQNWENDGNDGRHKITCIGQAFVGRFTLYGVWEVEPKDGKRYRFATVVLIRYGGKNDSCKWYYKDMDENCGPLERRMPMTLLKLLFAAPSSRAVYGPGGHGAEWRKACLQYHISMGRAKALSKRS